MKILVVGSHKIWRVGISKILAKEGLKVVECSHIDMVERVSRHKPNIVLMRADLGEIFDVVQLIYDSQPNTKVVMLSNSDRGQDVFFSAKNGANGYFIKETTINELMKKLSKIACEEDIL